MPTIIFITGPVNYMLRPLQCQADLGKQEAVIKTLSVGNPITFHKP